MSNPRVLAIISRNFPVPAAHRSFISNFFTLPDSQKSKTEERKPHLSEIKEEIEEKKNFEIHGGLVGLYQGGSAGNNRPDGKFCSEPGYSICRQSAG
jgi:hypothetical protein